MVTAVPPDFDILEMPFDDYLTKPVSRDDLVGVADRLSRRSAYDRTVQEYFSLTSKRVALEAEKPPESLETNEEYAALLDEIEALEEELDDLADRLDDDDWEAFMTEF